MKRKKRATRSVSWREETPSLDPNSASVFGFPPSLLPWLFLLLHEDWRTKMDGGLAIDRFIHCTEIVYNIVQCINRSIAKNPFQFSDRSVYYLYSFWKNLQSVLKISKELCNRSNLKLIAIQILEKWRSIAFWMKKNGINHNFGYIIYDWSQFFFTNFSTDLNFSTIMKSIK